MKKRVLLIDDDATMRTLLKTLLEFELFETRSQNGAADDPLSEIQAFKPHFILIDYHLKRQSGLELLEKIRADFTIPRPVILMTSGEDRKEQCLQSGADGFLLKPFMPGELISWLHEREQTIDLKKN